MEHSMDDSFAAVKAILDSHARNHRETEQALYARVDALRAALQHIAQCDRYDGVELIGMIARAAIVQDDLERGY
jgi:hypothetical protein